MKKLIQLVFITLCFFSAFCQSNNKQDTTLSKVKVFITPTKNIQNQDRNLPKSNKENFFILQNPAWITPIVTFIGFIITILLFYFQNKIRRKDDRLDKQLKRLDKQLSDLYGPLYARYQIGVSIYKSYIKSGNYLSFTDPNYRVWLIEVFMRTNEEIEKVIINNAELFIDKLPKECIQFCQHIAALKVCLLEVKKHVSESAVQDIEKQIEPYKVLKTVDNRMKNYPHPSYKLQAYVEVAYNIIQNERNKLLTNSRKLISEKNIFSAITKEYLNQADNIKIADEFYNRFLYLPYNLENNYNSIHNSLMKENNVRFEKIYWYRSEIDLIRNDIENVYLFLEEIEYKNGLNVCTKLFNNKVQLISKVNNQFYESGCLKEQHYYLYEDGKDYLTSKAIYNFNKYNKIEKLIYYEPVDSLEFTFKYEEIHNKIVFRKFDNNQSLKRYIEQEEISPIKFLFKWFDKADGKNNDIYAKCIITKNKYNYLEERIDIDPKTNQELKIQYIYDYNEKNLKTRLRKILPNGECELTQIYEYEMYS